MLASNYSLSDIELQITEYIYSQNTEDFSDVLEKDNRFDTWFDALEYMYQEALKIDFDVAILGCGAYGLPLAAKLKVAGKQAIHMGGVTQILFGIKGRRWLDNPRAEINFNDAWVYPKESETPKRSNAVENHCYW